MKKKVATLVAEGPIIVFFLSDADSVRFNHAYENFEGERFDAETMQQINVALYHAEDYERWEAHRLSSPPLSVVGSFRQNVIKQKS